MLICRFITTTALSQLLRSASISNLIKLSVNSLKGPFGGLLIKRASFISNSALSASGSDNFSAIKN
jgi:hypothetical protein